MALIIVALANGFPIETTWHFPFFQPPALPSMDIVQVTADGNELKHVLERFPNLPVPVTGHKTMFIPTMTGAIEHKIATYPRQVTWFGDMSKFIVANLYEAI